METQVFFLFAARRPQQSLKSDRGPGQFHRAVLSVYRHVLHITRNLRRAPLNGRLNRLALYSKPLKMPRDDLSFQPTKKIFRKNSNNCFESSKKNQNPFCPSLLTGGADREAAGPIS